MEEIISSLTRNPSWRPYCGFVSVQMIHRNARVVDFLINVTEHFWKSTLQNIIALNVNFYRALSGLIDRFFVFQST